MRLLIVLFTFTLWMNAAVASNSLEDLRKVAVAGELEEDKWFGDDISVEFEVKKDAILDIDGHVVDEMTVTMGDKFNSCRGNFALGWVEQVDAGDGLDKRVVSHAVILFGEDKERCPYELQIGVGQIEYSQLFVEISFKEKYDSKRKRYKGYLDWLL